MSRVQRAATGIPVVEWGFMIALEQYSCENLLQMLRESLGTIVGEESGNTTKISQ